MSKPIWFKAKRYGWGWTPATWQGWLILAAFVAVVVYDFLRVDAASHSVSDTLINWVPDALGLTLILIVICSMTGERPRWRWGDAERKFDGKEE